MGNCHSFICSIQLWNELNIFQEGIGRKLSIFIACSIINWNSNLKIHLDIYQVHTHMALFTYGYRSHQLINIEFFVFILENARKCYLISQLIGSSKLFSIMWNSFKSKNCFHFLIRVTNNNETKKNIEKKCNITDRYQNNANFFLKSVNCFNLIIYLYGNSDRIIESLHFFRPEKIGHRSHDYVFSLHFDWQFTFNLNSYNVLRRYQFFFID